MLFRSLKRYPSLPIEFDSTYKNIDVADSIVCAGAWLKSNPKKAAKVKSMKRFLQNWLRRNADRASELGYTLSAAEAKKTHDTRVSDFVAWCTDNTLPHPSDSDFAEASQFKRDQLLAAAAKLKEGLSDADSADIGWSEIITEASFKGG